MDQKYKIEGDHPIFQRIDWYTNDLIDLRKKMDELIDAGYEINIIANLSGRESRIYKMLDL